MTLWDDPNGVKRQAIHNALGTGWEETDPDDPKLKAINRAIDEVQKVGYKVRYVILTVDGHVIDLNNMTLEDEKIVRSIIDRVDLKSG